MSAYSSLPTVTLAGSLSVGYLITKKTTSGSILIPVPFPQSAPPVLGSSFVAVGSDIYEIGGLINDEPSPKVTILDCLTYTRKQAPNMMMARKNPSAFAHDGKIYAVGGLKDIDYKDVFNLKTQTWKLESIQRGSYPHHIRCLWSSFHDFVPCCVIDNMFWWYRGGRIEWFDSNSKVRECQWRVLKGMEGLLPKLARSCDVQLVDYGGKMAVLWHKFDCYSNSNGMVIWCAEIALERCSSEEIRGTVEWFYHP